MLCRIRIHRLSGLAELMEILERFTPLAQALPPSAAIAQLTGALRLFGVSPVDLAHRIRIRIQSLALYGLETAVGIGPSCHAAQLRQLGVTTIGQLATLPSSTATRILGRPGPALQECARGTDRRTVVPGRADRDGDRARGLVAEAESSGEFCGEPQRGGGSGPLAMASSSCRSKRSLSRVASCPRI
ncbi:hypothetical protein GCM10010232_67590 [Streptomyces amakusaensis]|uniref:UmuC domain-containing protein n=1 Tax=Streptomyces amakusaensis TaxID=67271 RepID=A0ABW0AVZ0_9ACTN